MVCVGGLEKSKMLKWRAQGAEDAVGKGEQAEGRSACGRGDRTKLT